MIDIQENIDIKQYTTFGVSSICSFFVKVLSISKLKEVLEFSSVQKLPILVLGGGSNMLFVTNFNGIVLKLETKGITETSFDENTVMVTSQAGEEWDYFVQYCVNKNYGGLENLSLIPGNVGTSPMQNIGAYGVEVKNAFHSLKALHIETGVIEEFTNNECKFGYRESVFKNELKNKYIILEVTFKLTKKNHTINVSYGAITEELKKQNITNPTLKDVREAVITIRKSKLPNPKELGNAGSFFKNPVISLSDFLTLQKKILEIPHYSLPNNKIKLPAGWLIETAGWKGKIIDEAGVHKKQALVLVNYGKATGKDIYNLSELIIQDINKKFNILLQREVNIVI